MAEASTVVANKPAWVDLSSSDPAGSREFYAKLFGWKIEVNPDPQYGGYAMANIGDKAVAGIGPAQSPDAPNAWSIYIGTLDAEALGKKVEAAGGTVIAPAFDVGDQGRMAVFQDPTGAFISAWQPAAMGGFPTNEPNTFAWAELNSRGVDRAIPFYQTLFSWAAKASEMPEGQPPYHEFQVDGHSVAGATEMNPMVPAEVPSYWLAYFLVEDIDKAFETALAAGGREMLPPMDFPGGRFAILSDPQGAAFGLMKWAES